MTLSIRDGSFDVVLVAGPRVSHWPSVGVRAVSTFCSEVGLRVGMLGGSGIQGKGVLPLPGTGAVVIAEDVQKRIHRIQGRAVVRINPEAPFPDPFLGSDSSGIVPIGTALQLLKNARVSWFPITAILGTGNSALRFGSTLLQKKLSREVYCIESHSLPSIKKAQGWEVEIRRFEMLGGKIINASPIELTEKAPGFWELRLKDAIGVRRLDVVRIVSAGPFGEQLHFREYPLGSLLFELPQTAFENRSEDIEGWILEETRGRAIATKIARALLTGAKIGDEDLGRATQKAKYRLKQTRQHWVEPTKFSWQGKWLADPDMKKLKAFSGVPKKVHKNRLVASLECFEDISCNLCEKACPDSAIKIVRSPEQSVQFLSEADCTACGACVAVCPSEAAVMIREDDRGTESELVIPWRKSESLRVGEIVSLLNRKGDSLGGARVKQVSQLEEDVSDVPLVHLEVPSHFVWEARGVRIPPSLEAPEFQVYQSIEETVEIQLEGDKRRARKDRSLAMALFEMGRARNKDVLLCPDGSCQRCWVEVDGAKKLSCKTPIHQGMSVRLLHPEKPITPESDLLCPCLGITLKEIKARLEQGQLASVEAMLRALPVGEGACHGQKCISVLRRLLAEKGLESEYWIDWRFPWTDWTL